MVWSAHMLASVTAGQLHSLSSVHFGHVSACCSACPLYTLATCQPVALLVRCTLWAGVTACCTPCPLYTLGRCHSLLRSVLCTLWAGVTACCTPCPLYTLGRCHSLLHSLSSVHFGQVSQPVALLVLCTLWAGVRWVRIICVHAVTGCTLKQTLFSKFQCNFSILLSQLIENSFKKNKILKTVGCYCCFIYSRSFLKLCIKSMGT